MKLKLYSLLSWVDMTSYFNMEAMTSARRSLLHSAAGCLLTP